MPELSGKETYLAIKDLNPDVKVSLSSGYSINGEAQEILDEGVLGFIQNPFRKAALAQKIDIALHPDS
jgi:DNA-binding NarL/FixJ family response regulator